MYPDPHGPGPAEDMDAAARREFFGPGGRRSPTPPPAVVPELGNGYDRPVVPDPTSDNPLSTHAHHDGGETPGGRGRHAAR